MRWGSRLIHHTHLPETGIRQASRILLALVIFFSLLGGQPAEPALAAAECSTVNLVPTADTWLRKIHPTWNYGADGSLFLDESLNTNRSALLRFDTGVIPSNAVVTSASLTLHIIDPSVKVFGLYNLLRPWTEGSGNGTETADGATWNTTDGSMLWGTPGANNTTSDRSAVSMWSNSDFSAAGMHTYPIDDLTAVQGWVDGSIANYGLAIQGNETTPQSEYLVFDAREGAHPPVLSITYCLSTPTLGDRVWDDRDGDGLQDISEAGYAGVTVTLHSAAGDGVVYSTVTNAAGLYAIDNPTPGSYYLKFTLPPYTSFSPAAQGTDPALDSDVDPITGRTPVFDWTGSQAANLALDAGLRRNCQTVTSRVSHSADDARENKDSGMSLITGKEIDFASTTYYWGIRFRAVGVPNGALIDHAAITLIIAHGASDESNTATSIIYGQQADNPPEFPDTRNLAIISPRPKTAASVLWNIPLIPENTQVVTYPLTVIVQEIVNRPGWVQNNAMVFLGYPQPNNTYGRVAHSYDGSPENAPLLTITYCNVPYTPSVVSGFSAQNTGISTALHWNTAPEFNTAGFNLYRVALNNNLQPVGSYVRLNASLIPSEGQGRQMYAAYAFTDGAPQRGRRYRYRLEEISIGLQPVSEKFTDYYLPFYFHLPMLSR